MGSDSAAAAVDEKQIAGKRTAIQPLETEADRQYELSQDFFVQHEQAKKDYDAVLIAIGAQKAMHMGLPGEDLEGVYYQAYTEGNY